VDVAPEWWPIL